MARRKRRGVVVPIVVGVVGVGLSALGFSYARKKPDEVAPDNSKPSDPWKPEPYERYQRGAYTVDLTGLSGGVRWRVWETTEPPTTDPAASQVIHAATEVTDDEARVAANAFVDALADAGRPQTGEVPIPTPDPPTGPEGGAGPDDGLDAGGIWEPAPPLVVASASALLGGGTGPGVAASADCTQLWVLDAVSWVAWASTRILEQKELEPVELAELLLGEAIPNCTWDVADLTIGTDKPFIDLLAEADDKILAKLRAGETIATFASQPSPAEIAAAVMVGVKPIAHKPPAFPYRGFYVQIVGLPDSGGGARWNAWRGAKKGPAQFTGVGTSRGKAVSYAMTRINQVLA